MPFATVAVPFDVYRDLPSPQQRWLLLCLARYADRNGVCWPSMRQLAADARISLSSVCRYLRAMADAGVFQRERRGVGRYRYTLAPQYVPRWAGHEKPRAHANGRGGSGAHAATDGRVSELRQDVPHVGTHKARQESTLKKSGPQEDPVAGDAPWRQRLRAWDQSGFWLPQFGPRPDQAGCWAFHSGGSGSMTTRRII